MTSTVATLTSIPLALLNCSEHSSSEMNCTFLTENFTLSPSSPISEEKEGLASLITRITLCCLVFVLNILGNAMVCIVVWRNNKLRSFRNYYYGLFLVNLSVADMTVAIFIMPFVLMFYETGKYPFGFYGSTAACKLVPTLSLMCQGASIYSLASLTLQRYIGIVYPLRARLTLSRVKLVLSLVWLFAFVNAFPLILVSDGVPTPKYNQYSCDEYWPNENMRSGYTMYLFLVEYLIPLCIISMTYTKMALVLFNREKEFKGRKSCSRNKVRHVKFIRLLTVLVASFAVCYLPNHVLFFWYDYGTGGAYPYFTVLMKWTHFCIWLNSCLNPYLYGALDEYFNEGFKKVIRQCARLEVKSKVTHSRIVRQLSRMHFSAAEMDSNSDD
ncbi:hypothetical protein QZH41_000948 [Actinostola sp. cb2023]|nr:hypothetical protein QZH41_000948 [Actinostola sp. cb2023]